MHKTSDRLSAHRTHHHRSMNPSNQTVLALSVSVPHNPRSHLLPLVRATEATTSSPASLRLPKSPSATGVEIPLRLRRTRNPWWRIHQWTRHRADRRHGPAFHGPHYPQSPGDGYQCYDGYRRASTDERTTIKDPCESHSSLQFASAFFVSPRCTIGGTVVSQESPSGTGSTSTRKLATGVPSSTIPRSLMRILGAIAKKPPGAGTGTSTSSARSSWQNKLEVALLPGTPFDPLANA